MTWVHYVLLGSLLLCLLLAAAGRRRTRARVHTTELLGPEGWAALRARLVKEALRAEPALQERLARGDKAAWLELREKVDKGA